MKNQISQNANRKNLLQLLSLRLVAIFGQLVVIFFARNFLEIALPLKQMFSVIALLSILSCWSFYRYKSQKNISNGALFFELIFDVSALTAQLYFSGGIFNPFISLFLLQVVIAAILLRPAYAWAIATLTIISYFWLSSNYLELAFDEDGLFDLHLHGMFLSYFVAAILLLIFITRIAENLRERERKSEEERQILRSAMLATAAAHDLGTPLNTISVVLGDWKNLDLENSAQDLRQDISLMESQIERCKKAVSDILSASGSERVEEANSDFKK